MAISPAHFRRTPASFVPSSSVTFYFGIPKQIYLKLRPQTRNYLNDYAKKNIWRLFGSQHEYNKARCWQFGMTPAEYQNEMAKANGFKNRYDRCKQNNIKKYGSEMNSRNAWAKRFGEKRGLDIKNYADYRNWKAQQKGFTSWAEYNSHLTANLKAKRISENKCTDCGKQMEVQEAEKFLSCEACRKKERIEFCPKKKEYREKNKEELKRKNRLYYRTHKKEMLAKMKIYKENNKDKIIQINKAYREKQRNQENHQKSQKSMGLAAS